jgi:hypothetical protein
MHDMGNALPECLILKGYGKGSLTAGEKCPMLEKVRNKDLKDSRRFDGPNLG